MGLAPSLAASLTTGQEVTITAAGQAYPAHLAEVTPELDSTTRSQIAFFELHAATAPPSRSTGEVTLIQEQPAKGAWVPLSALRQGPRGTWMLLTVALGDPAVIGTEAVELLHLDADSAFVRGSLQEGQLILPAGTHRVVPGEAVRLAEGS